MASFGSRVKYAWNAFRTRDQQVLQTPAETYGGYASSYGVSPDRPRLRVSNERSLITAIYTRISIDVAGVPIRHVRVDEEEMFIEDMKSDLQDCLKFKANVDQDARQFRQDIALSVLDKGAIAIVPVDADADPDLTDSYDIQSFRVGEVVAWHPKHVTVDLYNEVRGIREHITLSKRSVAVVQNPLYPIMNEPNSTFKRLVRKLSLLDMEDDNRASRRLDLIIQLPYVIKTEARRQQAEKRRKDIEFQLESSKYGIAYTDGTERITQLNRPAENDLLAQITDLTQQLFSQLGITESILNGTANEETMLNYMNRTIEPIMDAITESMTSSFISKTARTQGQRITYFTDPFKLVPLKVISEIADVLSRDEIMSSNEIRTKMLGMKPSKDPQADQLRNANMPNNMSSTDESEDVENPEKSEGDVSDEEYDSDLDHIDNQLKQLLALVGEVDELD